MEDCLVVWWWSGSNPAPAVQLNDLIMQPLRHRNAAVAEAGLDGFPHPIKEQGVYAYIVLQPGEMASPEVEAQLKQAIRTQIGAHAKVDLFQYVPGLPKTRSGKVMRRILRKVAEGQPDQLGDVSTLAAPSIVDAIKAGARALT